jgi:hypothetical protein
LGDGEVQEREYSPDTWYVISDSEPKLEFEVYGQKMQPESTQESGQKPEIFGPTKETPEGSPFWQTWNLGERVSSDRMLGTYELPLKVPKGTTLRCYVVPAKILTVTHIWKMIEEIQSETRRPVIWNPSSDTATRSWLREFPEVQPTTVHLLVEEVKREIAHANALRSSPPLEFDPLRGTRPIPEMAIVPIWARRRISHLELQAQFVSDEAVLPSRVLRPRAKKPHSTSSEKEEATLASLRNELQRVIRLVKAHLGSAALEGHAFSLGPAAQRDHRIRGLAKALAPPRSQTLSDIVASWSSLPALTVNRLFERWSAIWIVAALRSLGFASKLVFAIGASTLRSAQWFFEKGDIRITLDYEPRPRELDFGGLPPIAARSVDAVTWAMKRSAQDDERPFCASGAKSSPDLVLRIEWPGGRSMAIGDATLADPRYAGPTRAEPNRTFAKADTLDKYRKTIFWRAGADVVECHRMGAFAIVAGSGKEWELTQRQAGERDMWLFCLTPGENVGDAERQFEAFVKLLTSRPTQP